MLGVPAGAFAHGEAAAPEPLVSASAAPAKCPGDPIAPSQVITGEFSSDQEGSYVLVPFDVPAGTTAVRVKYCFDQPETPTSAQLKHTLDLGVYDAREEPAELFDVEEFRGWGGSSHPDVTISPEGFSTEAQYEARPKGHVPGKTTRGFEPGPVPAGEWAAELGLASIIGRDGGDIDGKVAWRIEVELSSDPAFADEPYRPAPYDRTPAVDRPGWYAGDMHVHAEHSALGDATMTETFGYAFGERAKGGAGLDFITLSDYVVGSHWDEIGRYQSRYPGKLILRSAEIITYRGHLNNHASSKVLDYRTGPLLERRPDGSLEPKRGPQPPSRLFDQVHDAGGFTQINHPTIFPSEVPAFAALCRGCPWDYTDEETDYRKVDAWEVHTGPPGNDAGNNPFTLTAIQEWEQHRRDGFDLTAVAVSDSHNAGTPNNAVTQTPIGVGTTVVYADRLSEDGVQEAIEAGHAYVKIFGPGGPDLRLDAKSASGTAMMGDELQDLRADFTARVIGGGPDAFGAPTRRLIVLKDGVPTTEVPVTSADFTYRFAAEGKGDYRIQLERGNAVEALANPITLGAAPAGAGPGGGGQPGGGGGGGPGGGGGSNEGGGRAAPKIRLSVSPGRVPTGRRIRFSLRATHLSSGRRRPVSGAAISFAGRRLRTDPRGRASMVKRFRSGGRYRPRASREGFRPGRAAVRVIRRSAAPRFTG